MNLLQGVLSLLSKFSDSSLLVVRGLYTNKTTVGWATPIHTCPRAHTHKSFSQGLTALVEKSTGSAPQRRGLQPGVPAGFVSPDMPAEVDTLPSGQLRGLLLFP